MTVNIQLKKPGGGFHKEINGVDDAVAQSMVAKGEARIVEGDLSSDEPIKDNRGNGVSMAVVESRLDAKLRLLEAKVFERMDARLRSLEESRTREPKDPPTADIDPPEPTEEGTKPDESAEPSNGKPEGPAEEKEAPTSDPPERAKEAEPEKQKEREPVDFDSLPEDLTELSVGQLRKLARKLDIEGRSKMNEAELVAAIEEIRTAPE